MRAARSDQTFKKSPDAGSLGSYPPRLRRFFFGYPGGAPDGRSRHHYDNGSASEKFTITAADQVRAKFSPTMPPSTAFAGSRSHCALDQSAPLRRATLAPSQRGLFFECERGHSPRKRGRL